MIDNELIFEFMGGIKVDDVWHDDDEFDDYKYHYSWSWLMPVVGKISETVAGGITYDIKDTLMIANIDATYKAVVEFIKWYNERKKKE